MASLLEEPWLVFPASLLLRAGMLVYGLWQDQNSALKYTDIDYYVFTDASRYVSRGLSPYQRDTYRYTPLLAWMLTPTAFSESWFHFGKVLFALGDVLTGILMVLILEQGRGFSIGRATKYACIWLLNPMVATISTRGSSEGLLAFFVMLLLWASVQKRPVLAGFLLGFAIHFKIYPFIYAVSVVCALGEGPSGLEHGYLPRSIEQAYKDLISLITPPRVQLVISSILSFVSLNAVVFLMYGHEFLEHTFLYHLVRSDHRHNFSPYNTMLYQRSSSENASAFRPESLAFVPQLALSAIIFPLTLSKRDLASTQLVQTLAFVAFNKVCTSQYFLWYILFLPFYLPDSTLLNQSRLGAAALLLWIVGQGAWLQQGYNLEFLGISTFANGLWTSSLLFLIINVWLLGTIVEDLRTRFIQTQSHEKKAR